MGIQMLLGHVCSYQTALQKDTERHRLHALDFLETLYAAHCGHQLWLPSLDEIRPPTSLCSVH